jgi:hypothetical protein
VELLKDFFLLVAGSQLFSFLLLVEPAIVSRLLVDDMLSRETHEDIESRPTNRETTFGFLELFCCLTPGLDWTRLFMSLTAGAGTRCMSLLPTSPILCLTHASLGTVPARFMESLFSWKLEAIDKFS